MQSVGGGGGRRLYCGKGHHCEKISFMLMHTTLYIHLITGTHNIQQSGRERENNMYLTTVWHCAKTLQQGYNLAMYKAVVLSRQVCL